MKHCARTTCCKWPPAIFTFGIAWCTSWTIGSTSKAPLFSCSKVHQSSLNTQLQRADTHRYKFSYQVFFQSAHLNKRQPASLNEINFINNLQYNYGLYSRSFTPDSVLPDFRQSQLSRFQGRNTSGYRVSQCRGHVTMPAH